jgi:hypothetical protein
MVARQTSAYYFRLKLLMVFVSLISFSGPVFAQLTLEDTSKSCIPFRFFGFLKTPIIVEVEPVSPDSDSFKVAKVFKGSAIEDEVVSISNISDSRINFKSKNRYVVFMRFTGANIRQEPKKLYTAITCMPIISMHKLNSYSLSEQFAIFLLQIWYYAYRLEVFLVSVALLLLFIIRKSRHTWEIS